MARKVAIVGGGVIGGAWASRFMLNGWDAAVFDPDPQADRKVHEVLANARLSLPALSDVPMPAEGRLTFPKTLAEALDGAEYAQESVSERLDLKHKVHRQVQEIRPDVPLASSTSGFRPSQLQEGAIAPKSIFVAHPFNPVYLLPLVEVVPSPASDPAIIARAEAILREIGMFPLRIRKEIDAHVADRMLEAVWREALWLVKDGIATTEEIDESIRMGFGLRWAQMGLFETYRVAGGEAGMRHFMAQFGPALKWPWTKLMDVPEYNDELVELIASQSDAQSGQYSIRELERIRDQNLVGFMRVLKERDWGAGKVLNEHDKEQAKAFHESPPPAVVGAPLVLARPQVLPGWIDYNGHMTEARYYHCNTLVADAFLALIGAGLDYVATGFSYYSVETHIRHLGQARVGDRLTCSVQVLSADEKRFRSFVRVQRGDELLATIEQLCLHVDAKAEKVVKTAPEVWEKLKAIADAHAGLPLPEGAGRAIGAPRR